MASLECHGRHGEKKLFFPEGIRAFQFVCVLPFSFLFFSFFLFLIKSLKPYMEKEWNGIYEVIHYLLKISILSSRSTGENSLIAQFFEIISVGVIKEAVLQMHFTRFIVYHISLWLFPLGEKELSVEYSRKLLALHLGRGWRLVLHSTWIKCDKWRIWLRPNLFLLLLSKSRTP